MQNCTLLAPSRDPGADATQILERDTATSAFSLGNDLLGNDVIYIGRKAILQSCQLPEFAVCPSRPLTLQFSSESAVPVANAFYGVAAVGSTIRIRCDIGNPKVDSKPFVNFPKGRFFHVTRDPEIPLSAMVDQVGLALTLLELFDLARTGHILNVLPAPNCPDVDVRFFAEAQYSIIVGNGPGLPEYPLSLFVEFVGICNLGKYANCELGIEFELLTRRMVEGLLKGEVGKDFDLPRLGTKPVRTGIAPMESG